jgi:hypothetical protein
VLELVFSDSIEELRDERELLIASSLVDDKVRLIEMVVSVLE